METRTLSGALAEVGTDLMSKELDGRTVSLETIDHVRSILDELTLSRAELAVVAAAWATVFDTKNSDMSVRTRFLLLDAFGHEFAYRHASIIDHLLHLGVFTSTDPRGEWLMNKLIAFSQEFDKNVEQADVHGSFPRLTTFADTQEHIAAILSLGEKFRNDSEFAGKDGSQQWAMAQMITKEQRSQPTPLTQFFEQQDLTIPQRIAIAILAHLEDVSEMTAAENLLQNMGFGRHLSVLDVAHPLITQLLDKGLITTLEDLNLRTRGTPVMLAEHVRILLGVEHSDEEGILNNMIRNGRHFNVVQPQEQLTDIMLEEEVRQQLQIAVKQVQCNVYDTLREWGIRSVGYGRTTRGRLVMLLHGPPGTGKTMAAYAIANELGRTILTIDASSFLNSYVGESEQRLRTIFAKYRLLCHRMAAPPVLVINEADSILNRRIIADRAIDQMANNIVSILLEEIERIDGILILTSNDVARMDEAFSRRIDTKIFFPRPNTDIRRQLWNLYLPASLIEGGEHTHQHLANTYDLTGSQIRTIVSTFATHLALQRDVILPSSLASLDDYIRREIKQDFDRTNVSPNAIGFLT